MSAEQIDSQTQDVDILPTVSVVIPTYNFGRYLPEAIESILQQTYRDFEIIVIDDGSTDDTKNIIQKYLPSVRYVRQENGGPSKARNTGIMMSKGKYIAFLDADDIWLPTKLEKQIAHFQRNPECYFVFTENCSFDDNGIYLEKMGKQEKLMKGNLLENIFLKSSVATPTVMVKSEVFESVGLFDESLRVAQDDNMWLRIVGSFKAGLLDEVLVKVRRSRKKEEFCIWVIKHLQLIEEKYPNLKSQLRRAIPYKYSLAYLDWGYYYFEKMELERARALFKQALQYNKLNLRALLYWLAALLPPLWLTYLRSLKQRWRKLRISLAGGTR